MIPFEKSSLSQCKAKIPSAYKILLKQFLEGKEFSEEDRLKLAIEIKYAYPDFESSGIATALGLEESEGDVIDEGVDAKTEQVNKEKESEKRQKKEEKRAASSTSKIKFPDTSTEGYAFVTPANVRVFLDHIGVSLRLNQFSNTYEIKGLEKFGHTAVTDLSLDYLYFRAKDKDIGLVVNSKKDLDAALNLVGHQNRYHPVKDYLESLKWDNTERLETWLIEHAGVKDDAYSRAVSALPLMAAVKRVYKPGDVFHEMLILQSKQGWGKSGAMKALCPNPDWFSDDLPLGCDAKTVIERTSGKWLIEAAEMQNFKKTDHNAMKAFMSRCSDRARLAFERVSSEVFRQFVIFGTVNEIEFLSDPTGDRRYWPLAMEKQIDEQHIVDIRDQLWAEAYHRVVVEGRSIRLDRSLWDLAEVNRKPFTVNNPFHEALTPILYGQTGRITNASLYEICGIPIEQRRGHAKMAKAMEDLGWKRSSPVWKDGSTVRCWEKGGSCRWLDPVKNNKTGKWEFKVNRIMTNAQMDQMTQGNIEFDIDELEDPSEKPN